MGYKIIRTTAINSATFHAFSTGTPPGIKVCHLVILKGKVQVSQKLSLCVACIHSFYLEMRKVLKRIVVRKHKQSLSQTTSEIKSHLQQCPVSTKIVNCLCFGSNLRFNIHLSLSVIIVFRSLLYYKDTTIPPFPYDCYNV